MEKGYKTMKKNFGIEDFKMNEYAYKPIEETGRISNYSGRFDINYSSILSKLIQEAGRYCESYASDLFIDWKSVDEIIDNAFLFMKKSFLFGFRQNGVDHDTFIFLRYEDCGDNARYNYRSLWRLYIETDEYNIKMKLGRVF